jgi:hypothetical protein
MRAQDALHFGRTDIYPRYHSGWGGPYGDGNYPARSMTIWVPRIGDVGELTIRLKRAGANQRAGNCFVMAAEDRGPLIRRGQTDECSLTY